MDIYQIGTEAWVQTKDNDWIAAKVESKVVDGDKVKLTFLLENGEVYCHKSSMVPWTGRWLTPSSLLEKGLRYHCGGSQG